MSLNKSQMAAVDHFNGPLLVLSGPGSGKTTVIVNRVANLIKKYGVKPENILVVTFTNSAATEMKERFIKGFDGGTLNCQPEMVTFGTFHSVFFGILKEFYGYNSENIIKEWEKVNILREILNSIRYDDRYRLYMEDTKENMQMLLKEITEVKHNKEYIVRSINEKAFAKIYSEYTKRVKSLRKIDFEDMLYDTRKLLETNAELLRKVRNRYQYILVDEYQDINEIQNEIVRLIAAPLNNIFAVGDDDQAIYGFRGAKPEIILGFCENYPDAGKVYLDVNYRCGTDIVEASVKLIGINEKRFEKSIRAAEAAGGGEVSVKAFENMSEQCGFIMEQYLELIGNNDYKKVAVLYRTNSNPTMLCQLLMENGIDFTIRDKVKNIYDNPMVIDMLTYLAIASGDMKRSNFLRIINKPRRDIPREIFDEEITDLKKVVSKAKNAFENEKISREQLKNIKEFCKGIGFIIGMNTAGAMSYIRYGLKYQYYIDERHRKTKSCSEDEDIMTIMEIVQIQAKKYVKIKDFLDFVDDYKRELYEGEKAHKITDDSDSGPSLTLSTIHGSKGLEYDAVFIMDANEKIIPHGRTIGTDSLEEERRLFYVAMTRAAKKLYILYTKERYGKELPVSRFVKEIGMI